MTPTFTPTSATTPAPTAGPNPVIFPNPVGTGSVALLPQSFAGTASVTVSLYTTSFKLVAVKTFPARSNGQTVMVDLVDDRGQPLANGIYYASVAVPGSKKTVTLVVQR